MNTARALAFTGLKQVLLEGRSLSAVLPELLAQSAPADRALLQKLLYGVLKDALRLQALIDPLLQRPLRKKDADIRLLLWLGAYQLCFMDGIPSHAAVNETVRLLPKRKQWARGLVNAILRTLQRQPMDWRMAQLNRNDEARYAHPAWLIDRLKHAWPTRWQQILEAANRPPPLTLRINPLQCTRDDFMAHPDVTPHAPASHALAPQAVVLREGVDVRTLPGFDAGWFSVQDAAAQQAAHLLAPRPGERILDACAAPGGKTTHIQELTGNRAHLLALEKDPARLPRLHENLQRLRLQAQVRQGDAGAPDDWWDGEPFDRILLDAPCSATGIIRRHPDIRHHRTPADIERLVAEQARILDALWPLLKPGGLLLYATCSILPEENDEQIRRFLARTPDAVIDRDRLRTLPNFSNDAPGVQFFPGQQDMDGFYYAALCKQPLR